MRALQLAILHFAALLAPRRHRREFLAEWQAELWYVREHGNGNTTRFCLGAIQDGLLLRVHHLRTYTWENAGLQSPVFTIFALAVLAVASVLAAMHLPASHGFRDDGTLVMLSGGGSSTASFPAFRFAEYQSIVNREKEIFARVAFYRPVRTRVTLAGGETVDLAIAFASRNLFQVLQLPVTAQAGELILRDRRWLKHAGSAVLIDGRSAKIAGVMQEHFWRLPGKIDGWLLADEPRLADLPFDARGFVVAELRSAPPHSSRCARWRQGEFEGVLLHNHSPWSAYALMLLLAVLILPATLPMELREYAAMRARQWMFLASKVILLLVIVSCGIVTLGAITVAQIQPHGFLLGYVLAFRWALLDERKRCPECLRRVTNPVQIGSSSQSFLGWYGEEFVCPQGHGLMQVPEIPAAYNTRRWLHLDQSWAGLFPTR